jgi:hypothetical protein
MKPTVDAGLESVRSMTPKIRTGSADLDKTRATALRPMPTPTTVPVLATRPIMRAPITRANQARTSRETPDR